MRSEHLDQWGGFDVRLLEEDSLDELVRAELRRVLLGDLRGEVQDVELGEARQQGGDFRGGVHDGGGGAVGAALRALDEALPDGDREDALERVQLRNGPRNGECGALEVGRERGLGLGVVLEEEVQALLLGCLDVVGGEDGARGPSGLDVAGTGQGLDEER